MFKQGDTPWNKGKSIEGHPAWNKGMKNLNDFCPAGHEFTEENSGTSRDGYRYCKECKRIKIADSRARMDPEDRKERARVYAKERLKKLRQEAITAYGGACVCCGESIPEFLHLDHVNNDGAAHRRELKGERTGGGSMTMLQWAKRNNWPDTLQLKCHNCGMAEGFYGYCPHDRP